MKKNKTERITFRLSKNEKDKLDEYAKEKETNISDVIRFSLSKILTNKL
tara:strand:- start:657 stop:803 length:147 start_codon:yes stop_codon:yes gene_type:complete